MDSKVQRNNRIDALKGIAILLTVIGHGCVENKTLVRWIFSFHMPLFFILSGYIDELKYSNTTVVFKDYVIKKLKTLIWPYYLYLPIGVAGVLFTMYPQIDSSVLVTNIIGRIFGVDGSGNVIGVIWFLMVLFWSEILLALMRIYRCEYLAWISGILSIVLFEIPYLNIPFYLELVLPAVTFVYIGKILYRYHVIDGIVSNNSIKLWMCLVLCVCILCGLGYNVDTSLASWTIPNAYLYWVKAVGWSLVLIIMMHLPQTSSWMRVLEIIGQNTLIILVLHNCYLSALRWASNILVPNTSDAQGNIILILLCVITVVLCCATSILLKKKMPFMISL